jgi:hypothetical protein
MSTGQTLYSAQLAATGLAQKAAAAENIGPTRLRQIIISSAAGGTFSLLDGTGGEGKMGIVVVPASTLLQTIDIPDDGIFFKVGIHAVIAGVTLVFGYG